MDRKRASCCLRQCAMELELKNVGQKISGVRHIRGYVVFRARIEKFFAARRNRSDALILQPQIPPRFVVIVRLDFAGKHFPAPLINQQSEGKKRDFLQRLVQQQTDIARSVRRLVDQSDLHEIFRRDRKRDRVADRLMETIVRAVAKNERARSL